MLRLAPMLLCCVLSSCRTSTEGVDTTVNPAAGSPTTPAPARDGMGSTGNTPAQQREHAGAPSAANRAPAAPATPASRCESDADCAISRFIPGDCCQDCQERAVLRAELEAQQKRCAQQTPGCRVQPCAAARMGATAACLAGACVAKEAGP